MTSQQSPYSLEGTHIGTFHLVDSFPIRVIREYAEHMYYQKLWRYGNMQLLARLLVFLSCLKAAQQLWSSFWIVPVETDIFSEIRGLPTYLPEVIDNVLLKLGDIETEFGRIRVRWP